MRAFGGIVMLRAKAVEEVGGYREDLIAGEEPELSVRLRRTGWRIWRLDAEMTMHDAGMPGLLNGGAGRFERGMPMRRAHSFMGRCPSDTMFGNCDGP